MFGRTLSLVRSHLVTLAAFALFGLSGGLLYGSCANKECTYLTYRQWWGSTGTPGWRCTSYDLTYANICYSDSADGNEYLSSGGTIGYTVYASVCSGCHCSLTHTDDVKCGYFYNPNATITTSGQHGSAYCRWNIPSS